MKVGLLGGLLVSGLLGMALVGLVPGLILLGIGAALAGAAVYQEYREERRAASWRARYPSYKY